MQPLYELTEDLAAAITVAEPHDCAMIAASLRRGRPASSAFEFDPSIYFALLRALEARSGDQPTPSGADAVVIEHPTAARPVRVVEGQGSPRRRVLVESPHYVKPPRS